MVSYAQVAAQGASEECQHSAHDYFQVSHDHRHSYGKSYEEQEYASFVGEEVDTNPTRSELQNLSKACERLWELDNRLTPGQDFEINVQGGKTIYEKEDLASNSLFSQVDRQVFRRPTFSRYFALLDNYSANQSSEERESREERQEQRAFVEEIFRTAPIQYLHKYLSAKGHVSEEPDQFKSTLHQLWFALYDRGGGESSSSAFEHVFVGEVKSRGGRKEVSGFHNWIHFYFEEARGRVDYMGLVLPRRRNTDLPDSQTQLLTVQFEWNGVLKRNSSIFVGTSPEFELALYTLCYFEGQEDNFLELGPYEVNVKVYRMGDSLASAFTTVEN